MASPTAAHHRLSCPASHANGHEPAVVVAGCNVLLRRGCALYSRMGAASGSAFCAVVETGGVNASSASGRSSSPSNFHGSACQDEPFARASVVGGEMVGFRCLWRCYGERFGSGCYRGRVIWGGRGQVRHESL